MVNKNLTKRSCKNYYLENKYPQCFVHAKGETYKKLWQKIFHLVAVYYVVVWSLVLYNEWNWEKPGSTIFKYYPRHTSNINVYRIIRSYVYVKIFTRYLLFEIILLTRSNYRVTTRDVFEMWCHSTNPKYILDYAHQQ